MNYEFSVSIPDVLAEKVSISEPFTNYSKRGVPLSYGVDLRLTELALSKTCKVRDIYLLAGKIEDVLAGWEKRYIKHLDGLKKEATAKTVDEKNADLADERESLESILLHTLDVDDAVDWERLRRRDRFSAAPSKLVSDPKIRNLIKFNRSGKPVGVEKDKLPVKPNRDEVAKSFGLLTRLFKQSVIELKFEELSSEWAALIRKLKTSLESAAKTYDRDKAHFDKEKEEENSALDRMKTGYEATDQAAIEEYCDLVLQSSEYPDLFPQSFDVEYVQDSKIIVVDYQLPSLDDLPTVESYRYIKTRNEVTSKGVTAAKRKKLYESVIYQTCVRTIHELLEADVVNAIEAVAFNGIVTHINRATGIEETKTVMSILANKEEFLEFDLARVDPKATFKHMKGISGTAMIDLTPVQPVMQIEKSDRRFVDSKAIAESLDESENLAAMDWEDFEHLVRELFEKEFASGGGEVKVTRASADGGVDAIAFDPDPIRGGKIVIQAKRYTNVVGVAAVRDLYGTVMNEGATKGILVTTSNYGRDSFDFAKDKPLTLLNGENLLYLLGKHGHKARIDIQDAKRVLKAREGKS